LEEFRVLESSYSAEYGRAGGSVMLAVTKSGTNRFHGSLWDYLRNDAFDAANAYTPAVNGVVKKPLLRQNQFGGALGGPVLLPGYNGRNRTFFFVSYQGLRVHQQGIALTTPLTAAERTGDFSDLLPGKVVTDLTALTLGRRSPVRLRDRPPILRAVCRSSGYACEAPMRGR